MEIHGIDLGNKDVKHHKKSKFANKVSQKEGILGGQTKLQIGGSTYFLGEGSYETDYNKTQKENTLISLFGALALNGTETVNRVVVGLPIQQYKEHKDTLKHLILSNRIQDVSLKDGPSRRIIIEDVEVAPEGVSAYHSLSWELKDRVKNDDLVIVDIGGRTTDFCLYSIYNGVRKIVHYQTIPVGMLNIYDEFIQAINTKYTLDKTLDDGERIFNEGFSYMGEKQDLSFTKPIIKEQVDKIFQELNMNFPIKTSQVLLVGGGGIVLRSLFEKRLPHVLISNEPVYGNAIGFKRIGDDLW